MKSFFENQSRHIITEIENAIKSIMVAVAWITDDEIIKALMEAGKKGVVIEIITSAKMFSDEYKRKHIEIISALKTVDNCKVYRVGSETSDYDSLMHHKFAVIDNKIVITGSYNWTKKAKRNNEDVIIIDNSENAKAYLDQFSKIKNQYFTKDRLWFDSLSPNWQKALLENINKKENRELIFEEEFESEDFNLDPTDLELDKILSLEKIELSDMPSTLREDYVDDFFKELIARYENPTEIEIQLAYVIANNLYSSISDLSPILNLKYLESIDCSGIDISSLKPLQKHSNIKELNLSYNDKLLVDMEQLKHLTNLKVLRCTFQFAKNYSAISELKNLEYLELYTNAGEIDIKWIKDLIKLKEFSSDIKISSLEHILQLKDLNILGIEAALITDLKPLYGLKKLKEVRVNQGIVKESDYLEFVKNYPLEQ